MRKLMSILCLLTAGMAMKAQTVNGPLGEQFSGKVIASKLSNPWTMVYGPDNFLWITEGNSYEISRIDPVKNTKTVLLNLSDKRNFPRYDKMPKEVSGGKPWPQNGLMGMALHPGLFKGSPYVYVSYIYHFNGADKEGNGCIANKCGCIFTAAIVQYEYNIKAQRLQNPLVICDTIPASNDHNGGHLLIAPVDGKDYLFYSVGDMGAGQFDNGGRLNHAQDPGHYEGKILRFNIRPDKDAGTYDRWIPDDNPFNAPDRQSAVWSLGHRNPQGLTYGVINGNGHVFSSEHGPYSDDEINIIEKGKNYGHPLVIGYADGNYDGLAAGVSKNVNLPGKWHTTYPLIDDEKSNVRTIGVENYSDPLITLYPNSNDFLKHLFQQVRDDVKDTEWPSEAPSSIAVYTSSAIPGWKNSLLIPTLKGGKLIRLKLNDRGNKIVSDTVNYFKGKQRYRAIAIAPSGEKLYMSVDSSNVTSGPSKEDPQKIMCSGCIIEFTYQK